MPVINGSFRTSPIIPQNTCEEKPNNKLCKFIVFGNNQCGKICFGEYDLCLDHQLKHCHCGKKAIKECQERYNCKEYLCDNFYCEVSHNEMNKHFKRIY